MIEQLMKTVKRGNKKRSLNITIGAVVGFLLSCISVMGADNNYLYIKNDGNGIKFSIDSSKFGESNPYIENTWNVSTKTYINNITLSGTNNLSASRGYGLRLEGNLGKLNLINNGNMTGTGSGSSYGIYLERYKQ
ncbi:hypothetical protein [Fusobacterium sp.]|uniref:hypothetical protein n=1 Tax=Fusobacterium sp. TaxID=68766 RepID=UPI0029032046|nr:hypothetical protein [Fusobacterium sp.]MDU1912167.1 hypothetical protein [Fusobacterium sp.]